VLVRSFLVLATVALLPLLAACGENCQTTCTHLYDGSQCGFAVPGLTPADLIGACVSDCEAALQTAGKAGYDPYTTSAAEDSIRLENEEEVANWIDCVWDHAPEGAQASCVNINPKEGGVCAPI
jgi:hypothetical protein